MKVYSLMFEILFVQENAPITLARTNVLVILDTVGPIVLLTLMNVNLHHADTVSKILLLFSTKADWQFGHKND